MIMVIMMMIILENYIRKHMKILEKLQLVKEMIRQPGCLLDYLYFKENYKMISIDLSKQQGLDADPQSIQ